MITKDIDYKGKLELQIQYDINNPNTIRQSYNSVYLLGFCIFLLVVLVVFTILRLVLADKDMFKWFIGLQCFRSFMNTGFNDY